MNMVDRGASRPEMDHEKERLEMLRQHHEKTLWVYWSLIFLGFWLIATPLTFNYDIGLVSPSGGREVWLSLEKRIACMKYSDLFSGLLLIILGFRSLKENHPLSLWLACFIGVWLSFAPILFWAPNAISSYNDTFIGMLIIALTILIPGMPNMVNYMEMGTSQPPGWSYNPSSWSQRWILIVLGFAGWMVSRYLAAYQLGYIDEVWDPFFGESTKQVLNSKMSHALPISDAGLGSFAYTFEFLMGYMGSPARWRTMPWMVAFFGILVIPLGLVHIFLVISQPVLVGYWCAFCLLAALIMLPMIPLEVDEVIAMGQFLRRKVKAGESFWKIFWKGGAEEEEKQEIESRENMPDLYDFTRAPKRIFQSSLWGMTFPLSLIANALLGIMVVVILPQKLHQIIGLLVFTFSVIAMGETMRPLRFLNTCLGLAITVSAFIINSGYNKWIGIIAGALIIISSIPRGKIIHRFAGWDRLLK
jgi:hypothetical protein